jgi:uncharacterized damage-inducible protein DinB
MITSVDAFLRYFDSVHRRTLRDIAALPPEAASWRPEQGQGESAWDIAQIVRHIAGSRMYFASAYRGEGWLQDWPTPPTEEQTAWLPTLEASAEEFRRRLRSTPDAWLQRRIPMIDTDAFLSGWRILMMMVEHEVHHRSQVDAYAGLQGWPVPDIFNRSAEAIGQQREAQYGRYRGTR